MRQFIKFFSIMLIFVTISLRTMGEELKHQAIPVGMFNVYSKEDGNLGLPTPDLREVWEGMPTDWGGGYYPYEACNLVQHYWPKNLPRVYVEQEVNAAWWIDYLRQVYEAGNDNVEHPDEFGGEVRLRAIVGALYEPYDVYGETWFINFIKALCEWEQSGPQNGVIAGWYLAEEPMGSSHNYDPNVLDDMVAAIESVESEGGYRRHDRYVDVTLGGAHYSHQNLIRFTRPADVVMLSSGTFLWLISGAQRVYYPKWENIHINLHYARNIIFPDRDRKGLPRPKIHVVLEVYDTKGYGQPTNWEIRQQIRTALSPDIKIHGKTSEPADGIWFFWWTGLTFENDERVSDWVFGRRVAEAVEMEVAAMTGNRQDIQSQNMPIRSRFAFPIGAFNPDESAIPYELAEPGRVRIEVLDADMVLIDDFEMGVQSAGLLHRFGGPRWTLSSSEPDGDYIFKLYVDSILMDAAKVEVQSRPGVTSSSHIPTVWSKENVVKVSWRPPALNSGLKGFSFLWNTSSSGYPKQTANLSRSSRELESEALPDGNSHYFHLRSVDDEGNLSSPAHLGPFYIDTTPPSPVTDLISISHSIGQTKWSVDNTIDISWNKAQDATSGLRGYSYLWDASESTLPPENVNLGWAVTSISSEPLPDGQWYFHIRGVDVAGNWNSEAKHFGPFGIDTQPPDRPSDLMSSSHQVAVWSNQNEILLSWQPAEDEGSGIAGYLALWDTSNETTPTISNPQTSLLTQRDAHYPFTISDGKNHYFHLRSMDKAGQLSAETLHLGPFYIDTMPPSAVKELTLFDKEGQAHNPQDWLTDGNIRLQWQHAEDEGSGIVGYAIVQMNGEMEGWKDIGVQQSTERIVVLPDGEWAFQIRAQDNTGNLGEMSEISVRIDSYIATQELSSPSHPNSENWYPDNSPIFTWTSPTEVGHPEISGIAGYSWVWDNSPLTVPDETLDLPGDATTLSEKLEATDGFWYFHLKAYDNAGNVSETAHYKVQIDASALKMPIIISDTHPTDKWISNRDIRFRWNAAEPVNLSGISDVSFLVDKNSINEPAEIPSPIRNSEFLSQAVEADGIWYIHLKVQSGAGLWSQTAHYEVQIDTTAPKLILSSPTHPNSDQWYADNSPTVTWDIVETETSGIAGYSWVWDNSPLIVPDETLNLPGDATFQIPHSAFRIPHSDGVWYFHLKAYDNAGNVSETAHYKIQIDSATPAVPKIRSLTHPSGQWTSNSMLELNWQSPAAVSGIARYSFLLDHDPSTVPDEQITANVISKTFANLPDGTWYFHLRAKSATGLWSDTAHYETRVDTEPPSIEIDFPQSGKWYNESITEYYGQARDEVSGIAWNTLEYRYGNLEWKKFSRTDEATSSWRDTDEIPHTSEADGLVFLVRVRDLAGNLGVSAPTILRVDSSPPKLNLMSPTHPDQQAWYSNNQPVIIFYGDSEISGTIGYSWSFDQQPISSPPEIIMQTNNQAIFRVPSDNSWYFHLKSQDGAGNWSKTYHYRLNIDTTPPYAKLECGIHNSIPHSEIRNPNPAGRVGTGKLSISLKLSEPLPEGNTPKLYYQTSNRRRIHLDLKVPQFRIPHSEFQIPMHWEAVTHIDMWTGDGTAEFFFEATDRAGNIGTEITEGKFFEIDTLLRKDATEIQYVSDEIAQVTLSIPPDVLEQDMRIKIDASTEAVGSRIKTIVLRAFDADFHELSETTFRKPIEMTIGFPAPPAKPLSRIPQLFYSDGAKTHQIGGTIKDNAITARINHLGTFEIVLSEPVKKKITHGWAAPNPFTPNGSGDGTDRTIFHVATQDNNIQFTIKIFDLNGRLVRILENNNNIWDGRDEHRRVVEGGLYIYQIRAGEEVISGTVVVVK